MPPPQALMNAWAGREKRKPEKDCTHIVMCPYGYYVSEKYDCLHVYGKCFLVDALSYSQKVLGLQNVTLKEHHVVAIKSV